MRTEEHALRFSPAGNVAAGLPDGASRYLDLMKRCLVNWIYPESEAAGFSAELRAQGLDWPTTAHTMIGMRRLDNLHELLVDVLARDVPGDFIETGVWRGGATIFMRAALCAYGIRDRVVYVADSFAGLPPPDPERYPQDAGDTLFTRPELAVSLDQVRANFARYGLLDEQVLFLEGWFRDTLPDAPMERLALLRLDGDMYESTMDALTSLYPKLSTGGYVVVDDYGAIPACREAVHDFRAAHGIDDEIHRVDWTGVFWQRGGGPGPIRIASAPRPAERSAPGRRTEIVSGYWLADAAGRTSAFGAAPDHGSLTDLVSTTVAAMVACPTGGYWLVDVSGGVYSFGGATFHGAMGDLGVTTTIAAAAATPSGGGYWLLDAGGGVYTFGDAPFQGTLADHGGAARAVAISASPGGGYWILDAGGRVLSFGDATAHGGLPDAGVGATPVALAAASTVDGYWVVDASGGVHSFGEAPFHGSLPQLGAVDRVAAFLAAPGDEGYYLVSSRGAVVPYGKAPLHGSLAASPMAAPLRAGALHLSRGGGDD